MPSSAVHRLWHQFKSLRCKGLPEAKLQVHQTADDWFAGMWPGAGLEGWPGKLPAGISESNVSLQQARYTGESGVQELEDRYSRLRLETQMAADRGEQVRPAELIQRVMRAEEPRKGGRDMFSTVATR